jgi:hypothetical protein
MRESLEVVTCCDWALQRGKGGSVAYNTSDEERRRKAAGGSEVSGRCGNEGLRLGKYDTMGKPTVLHEVETRENE